MANEEVSRISEGNANINPSMTSPVQPAGSEAQSRPESRGFFDTAMSYASDAASILQARAVASGKEVLNAQSATFATPSGKAENAQRAIVSTLNEYLPEGIRSDVREKFIDHMVKNSPAILYSKRENIDGGRHHQALNKLLKDASKGTWREHDANRTMPVGAMKELAGHFVTLNNELNQRAAQALSKDDLSPAAMRVVAKRSGEIVNENGPAARIKEALHLDARHALNRLNQKEGSDVGRLSKEDVRELAFEVRGQRFDKVAELVDQSGKGAPTAERLADNIVALDKKIAGTLGKSLAAGKHELLEGNVAFVSDYIATNSERMAKNPVAAVRCAKELNEKLRVNMGLPEGDEFKALSIGTIRNAAKLMQQRDSATLDYLSMAKEVSNSAEIKKVSAARFGNEVAAQHAGIVKTIEEGGLGEKSQAARRVVLDHVFKNRDMETVSSRNKVELANELGKVGDMPYRNRAERAVRRTGVAGVARAAMSPVRANLGELSIGIQDRDLQKAAHAFSKLQDGASGRLNVQLNKGIETAKIDRAEQKVHGFEDKLEKYFPSRAALGNGNKPITEMIREKAVASKDLAEFQKSFDTLRRDSNINAQSDDFRAKAPPEKLVEELYKAHKEHEALTAPVRKREAENRAESNSAGIMDSAYNAAKTAAGVANDIAESVGLGGAFKDLKLELSTRAENAIVGSAAPIIDAIQQIPRVGAANAMGAAIREVTGIAPSAPALETPVVAERAPVPARNGESAADGGSTFSNVAKGAAVLAAITAAYHISKGREGANESSLPGADGNPVAGSAGKAIEAIRSQADAALNQVKDIIPGVGSYVSDARSALGAAASSAQNFVGSVPEAAGEIAQKAVGSMTVAAGSVADAAGRVADAASIARDAVSTVPGQAGELAQRAATTVANAAGTARDTVSNAGNTAASSSAYVAESVASAARDAISAVPVGQLAQTAASTVVDTAGTARDAMSSAAKAVGTYIGEENVKQYGPAVMGIAALGAAAFSMSGKAQAANTASPGDQVSTVSVSNVGPKLAGLAAAGTAALAFKSLYDTYSSKSVSVDYKSQMLQAVTNNSALASRMTGIPEGYFKAAAFVHSASSAFGSNSRTAHKETLTPTAVTSYSQAAVNAGMGLAAGAGTAARTILDANFNALSKVSDIVTGRDINLSSAASGDAAKTLANDAAKTSAKDAAQLAAVSKQRTEANSSAASVAATPATQTAAPKGYGAAAYYAASTAASFARSAAGAAVHYAFTEKSDAGKSAKGSAAERSGERDRARGGRA